MEKRIGGVLILVDNPGSVTGLNTIISNHSDIIMGRQGIPLKERGINIISLIVEGSNNDITSLTGQIGRLDGVSVKSVLSKK